MTTSKKALILFIAISAAIGLFLRVYMLDFGLPFVTFADEDKLGNPAIRYTLNIKDLITHFNVSKIEPDTYVYGTFPVYLNVVPAVIYKAVSVALHKTVDFYGYYLSMRVANLLFSIAIPIFGFLLYKKFIQNSFGSYLFLVLLLFNWKLIVHSHYLNADIILTSLILASFYYLYEFHIKGSNKFLILSSILFGLAVGTKITALLSAPLILLFLLSTKKINKIPVLVVCTVAAFVLSNPFSVLNSTKYLGRIQDMRSKENGIVFDSVDFSPTKYLTSLSDMATFPVFLFGLAGMLLALAKTKEQKQAQMHQFLIANFLVYLAFFTFSTRKVDRWVLPMIPVALFYFSYFSVWAIGRKQAPLRYFSMIVLAGTLVLYCNFAYLLIGQFGGGNPQVLAFRWMRKNVNTPFPKLLVTDSLLDPSREIKGTKQLKVNVYTSAGAQNQQPDDPTLYEYITVLSRAGDNHHNPIVQKMYPEYAKNWYDFEYLLGDSSHFEVIKEFSAPYPNLIPLSTVTVYKNLFYVPVVDPLEQQPL